MSMNEQYEKRRQAIDRRRGMLGPSLGLTILVGLFVWRLVSILIWGE